MKNPLLPIVFSVTNFYTSKSFPDKNRKTFPSVSKFCLSHSKVICLLPPIVAIILFVNQQELRLYCRQKELRQKFIPDFICYGKIIVEIKAVSKLTDEHRAQVINYLNATGFELGILVNFGGYPKLEWERLVHTRPKSRN